MSNDPITHDYDCRGCDRKVSALYSVGGGRFQCRECLEKLEAEQAARAAMTPFERWLNDGYTAGWCSAPVCDTHDGTPTTADEDDRWMAGSDPCVRIVRLYDSPAMRAAVEQNTPAAKAGP